MSELLARSTRKHRRLRLVEGENAGHRGEHALNGLMLADLQRSGLDRKDAKRMGLVPVTAEEAKAARFEARRGYLIPYFDTRGRKLDRVSWRIRYLDGPAEAPFAGEPQGKVSRYGQRRNTYCRFYLSPVPGTDWEKLASDTAQKLILTEGEKKAYALTRAGLPAIGLGGVANWKATKKGRDTIPDFDLVKWKDREVEIVFDSDSDDNAQVALMMNQLAAELVRRGARAARVDIPPSDDGDRAGADDFLVANGVDVFAKLPRERFEADVELHRLNDEYAIIKHPTGIYDRDGRDLITHHDFTKIRAANRIIRLQTGQRGSVAHPAAEEWLKWAHRSEYSKLVFEPGEPAVLEDGSYNLWRLPFEPKKPPNGKKVDPFKRLVDHVLKGAEERIPWLTKWMAYPHQHRGTKLFTAVLLHGRDQGAGKSLLGDLLRDTYGVYGKLVEPKDLTAPFNDWAYQTQFVQGDEILGDERRGHASDLKNLITRGDIRVNRKFQPAFTIRDTINYYLTSNYPDAIPIDESDRRFFVARVEGIREQKFYREARELRQGDGPAWLLWHFLEVVDCAGFDPRSRAPWTGAKEEMAYHNDTPVERWVRELLENPDKYLQISDKPLVGDLWEPWYLEKIANEDSPYLKLKSPWIGRALRKLGREQYHVKDKKTDPGVRLYAIRNPEKWGRVRKSDPRWRRTIWNQYEQERRERAAQLGGNVG